MTISMFKWGGLYTVREHTTIKNQEFQFGCFMNKGWIVYLGVTATLRLTPTTVGIWYPDTFKNGAFWRSDFKWSGFSPNHLKTGPSKCRLKGRNFKWHIQDRGHFSQFSNGQAFRTFSKSATFANQHFFDHWKSKILDWYSNGVLNTGHHLNTRQVKACYVDVSIIQIPSVYKTYPTPTLSDVDAKS